VAVLTPPPPPRKTGVKLIREIPPDFEIHCPLILLNALQKIYIVYENTKEKLNAF